MVSFNLISMNKTFAQQLSTRFRPMILVNRPAVGLSMLKKVKCYSIPQVNYQISLKVVKIGHMSREKIGFLVMLQEILIYIFDIHTETL